jgi:hypothetical protein
VRQLAAHSASDEPSCVTCLADRVPCPVSRVQQSADFTLPFASAQSAQICVLWLTVLPPQKQAQPAASPQGGWFQTHIHKGC